MEGSWIDYFVVSHSILHLVKKLTVVPTPFKPHLALRLEMDTNPKAYQTLQVIRPSPFTGLDWTTFDRDEY